MLGALAARRRSAWALALVLLASSPAVAFDTWWHAEATRHGMSENGFSADARLVAQVTNYLLDFYSVSSDGIGAFEGLAQHLPGGPPIGQQATSRLDPRDTSRLHFDAVYSEPELELQWSKLAANTKAALHELAADASVRPGFRPIVLLTILGASLHSVQDFYAHSNWVNEWIHRFAVPIPIWPDVSAADRAALPLHTGAYPNGCCPGHEDHEKLTKDSSNREFNSRATEVANRASAAWVKMLLEEPGIPWDELKAYQVPEVAGKRFLQEQDATFLTTSAILAGHFDGPSPKKLVFSKDPEQEKRMARAALIQVMARYSVYLAVVDNPYRLPSPYWVGYLEYHVERRLAKGLTLAGEPR